MVKTTITYICDRCMSTYDGPLSEEFGVINPKNPDKGYYKRIELCPDCLASLKKWFNMGRPISRIL